MKETDLISYCYLPWRHLYTSLFYLNNDGDDLTLLYTMALLRILVLSDSHLISYHVILASNLKTGNILYNFWKSFFIYCMKVTHNCLIVITWTKNMIRIISQGKISFAVWKLLLPCHIFIPKNIAEYLHNMDCCLSPEMRTDTTN